MFLNCFSCTRDDRKERIVAAGNSVRQALQELLSEYMENAGTKPTEQLDDAIQVNYLIHRNQQPILKLRIVKIAKKLPEMVMKLPFMNPK